MKTHFDTGVRWLVVILAILTFVIITGSWIEYSDEVAASLEISPYWILAAGCVGAFLGFFVVFLIESEFGKPSIKATAVMFAFSLAAFIFYRELFFLPLGSPASGYVTVTNVILTLAGLCVIPAWSKYLMLASQCKDQSEHPLDMSR